MPCAAIIDVVRGVGPTAGLPRLPGAWGLSATSASLAMESPARTPTGTPTRPGSRREQAREFVRSSSSDDDDDGGDELARRPLRTPRHGIPEAAPPGASRSGRVDFEQQPEPEPEPEPEQRRQRQQHDEPATPSSAQVLSAQPADVDGPTTPPRAPDGWQSHSVHHNPETGEMVWHSPPGTSLSPSAVRLSSPVSSATRLATSKSASADSELESDPPPRTQAHFKMENCTLHCRGVPEDQDAKWLRFIFAEYGEVVQANVRDRHKLGKKANYALITFRTEEQMQKLLDLARKGEGVRPREGVKAKWNRGIRMAKAAGKLTPQDGGKLDKNWSIAAKKANEKVKSQQERSATGAWRVRIRAFQADEAGVKAGFDWLEAEPAERETRLYISVFDSEKAQNSTGGLADIWDAATREVREYMSDFSLFLAIDRAKGLPAMDLNSGDPFCVSCPTSPPAFTSAYVAVC